MMNDIYPDVFFSESKGVRHLHLGTEDWIQGSMSIRRPFDIELEYVRNMMGWMLFIDPETLPQCHAMQLGLGAGAITKFCHQRLEMCTTAVELNPNVVNICHAWFALPDEDEKLNLIIGDAQEVINDDTLNGTVDVLCVDIYDEEARAPVIDTAALYARCKALLTEQGIMTVNLFGRQHSYNQSLTNIAKGFGTTINDRQNIVWQFNPTFEGNTVVMAMAHPPSVSKHTLQERAALIEEKWGFPAQKWLHELKRAEPIKSKKYQRFP